MLWDNLAEHAMGDPKRTALSRLTLRSGDVDVYTPIHTQVQALWDQHGAPTFDIAPLLTQAKALFVQKVNFLVHQ